MTDVEEGFAAVAAAHPRCFWLDGGGAREWSGSRSILGWLEPDDVSLSYSAARREVARHAGGRSEVVGDDVFAVLAAELAAGEAADQWFGYLGYAARPDLAARPDPHLPDAVWMRARHVRFFEHGPRVGREGGLPEKFGFPRSTGEIPEPGRLLGESPSFSVEVSPENLGFTRSTGEIPPLPTAYSTAFDAVQHHLRAGNTYETNLTYRREQASESTPAQVYRRLRALNPAPYAGFLQHDVEGARAWLLSSSPERYAVVRRETGGRTIETKPIKGTTARTADPAADAAAAERLRTDPKFRAENLMIVDLLRNDLAQVCEVGSVEVTRLMQVESYPSVHQLVSTIRGRLRDDVDTVAALRALFPAGSMTGAPKRRTMEIIDAVEETPRGVYAGAFGWLAADGRADLGVVIRSLTTAGDGRYRLGTGGGITVLSDPAEEWAETQWKAERLLRALG